MKKTRRQERIELNKTSKAVIKERKENQPKVMPKNLKNQEYGKVDLGYAVKVEISDKEEFNALSDSIGFGIDLSSEIPKLFSLAYNGIDDDGRNRFRILEEHKLSKYFAYLVEKFKNYGEHLSFEEIRKLPYWDFMGRGAGVLAMAATHGLKEIDLKSMKKSRKLKRALIVNNGIVENESIVYFFKENLPVHCFEDLAGYHEAMKKLIIPNMPALGIEQRRMHDLDCVIFGKDVNHEYADAVLAFMLFSGYNDTTKRVVFCPSSFDQFNIEITAVEIVKYLSTLSSEEISDRYEMLVAILDKFNEKKNSPNPSANLSEALLIVSELNNHSEIDKLEDIIQKYKMIALETLDGMTVKEICKRNMKNLINVIGADANPVISLIAAAENADFARISEIINGSIIAHDDDPEYFKSLARLIDIGAGVGTKKLTIPAVLANEIEGVAVVTDPLDNLFSPEVTFPVTAFIIEAYSSAEIKETLAYKLLISSMLGALIISGTRAIENHSEISSKIEIIISDLVAKVCDQVIASLGAQMARGFLHNAFKVESSENSSMRRKSIKDSLVSICLSVVRNKISNHQDKVNAAARFEDSKTDETK